MRRTERLFALSEHLRSRRTGVTAEQLAERFGVTVRTIYRDLDSLRAAAFPVHAERGRGGGYALDKSYTLPPVNFNAREAAVLLAAGDWLTHLRLIPFTNTLQSAIEKVRAALPEKSQRELQRLQDSLRYSGVPTKQVCPKVRQVIEQAWFENVAIEIHYQGAHANTLRHVQIEQVVMGRSETILNCYDLDKKAKRQFKLHRVMRAKCAESPPL